MLRSIDKFMKFIEELILGIGIIVMALVLILNVILRTFFSSGLSFSEEIGQILLMSVTFVGVSYVARYGNHIRMSAVYDIVKTKYKKILATIISFVTSLTLFWLSYKSITYVLVLRDSFRLTPALRIPVYIITLIVTYGFISSAFQYLYIFYLNIKNKEVFIGLIPEKEDSLFISENKNN